jgi:hypothetical protein
VIITLFYLKIKKLSEVKIEKLKQVCKKYNLKPAKGSTKEELCQLLAEYILGNKVDRINKNDLVKYNNLKRI